MISNYKLTSEATKEKLKENNFVYIDGYYSYRFPVYKYKKDILLWCLIYIDLEEKNFSVNVVKSYNNSTYPAFYNRKYGKNRMVESIDRKIKQQLDILIKDNIIKKELKKKTKYKKKDDT